LGHAQLFRRNLSDGREERLTHDDRVNWFAHPSPDGRHVVYVSFVPGTVGHEANVPVQIRRMRPDGSEQTTLVEITGGQGTMNVSSWSPDGKHFAFVAYPIEEQSA
jgi:TolB protein